MYKDTLDDGNSYPQKNRLHVNVSDGKVLEGLNVLQVISQSYETFSLQYSSKTGFYIMPSASTASLASAPNDRLALYACLIIVTCIVNWHRPVRTKRSLSVVMPTQSHYESIAQKLGSQN